MPIRIGPLGTQIAGRTNAVVVVADYPLAPEHVFPAAQDDAQAAYRGLVAHGFLKIAIAGDSAGGCMALALLSVTATLRRKVPTQAPKRV